MSGVKVILSLVFSKERVEGMKVLMLNGSAKKEGNTYQSLLEVGKELERQGIEYEIFQIGSQPVRDCIGCGQCNENGCVFADDKVNEFVAKAKEADGFVFGTPVYWNMVHGCEPGEVKMDAEGMQTMRNLAKNLAWMMKCFEAGKVAGVPLPETERGNQTNFIR